MKWLRLLALSALLFGTATVSAQDSPADSRATTFQAVEGASKEQVPGGPLLVSAYAFVLVMLVGYVARLGLLQRKTAADVERLSQAIEQKRKA
jgi:hypothetical protein